MPRTRHRRSAVRCRVPDAIIEQFNKRFPSEAKNALMNATFHAAVRYPELAWRLIRNYAEPDTVFPEDWMPPSAESPT